MARFKAPTHTSEVFLPSGPARVDEDGFVMVENPSDGDIRGLLAAGFTAEPEKVAAKAATPAVEKE
jgi:hypothetical protein